MVEASNNKTMPAGNDKRNAVKEEQHGTSKAPPSNSIEELFVSRIKGGEFLYRVVVFLLRFLLLAVPAYLLFKAGIDFTRAQELVASQTAWLLNQFGIHAATNSYLIMTKGVYFEIVEACTAWRDAIGLIALVVAVPGVAFSKRLWSILGLPVIYIVNILRLATTIAIGNYYPSLLVLAHDVLWKFFSAIFIVIIWAAWLKWAPEGRKKTAIKTRTKTTRA